jgi:hypothetical protein
MIFKIKGHTVLVPYVLTEEMFHPYWEDKEPPEKGRGFW